MENFADPPHIFLFFRPTPPPTHILRGATDTLCRGGRKYVRGVNEKNKILGRGRRKKIKKVWGGVGKIFPSAPPQDFKWNSLKMICRTPKHKIPLRLKTENCVESKIKSQYFGVAL